MYRSPAAQRPAFNADESATAEKNTWFRVEGIIRSIVNNTLFRGCVVSHVTVFVSQSCSGDVWVQRMEKLGNGSVSVADVHNTKRRPKMTDPLPQYRGEADDIVNSSLVLVMEKILDGRTNADRDDQLWGAARQAVMHTLRASRSDLPDTGEIDDTCGNGLDTLMKGEQAARLADDIKPEMWGIINPMFKGISQTILAQNEGVSKQAINNRLAKIR